MTAPATRPFVDRPVGDLAGATALAERFAGELGLPSPALLRSGMNALFVAADTVIRVGRTSAPAAVALELARALTAHGIRVPLPATDLVAVDGDLSATGWQRLPAIDVTLDWPAVGELVRTVHRLDPSDLPDAYPRPSPAAFPWWDFAAMLADVGDEIDDTARAAIEATVERHADWSSFDPDECVVCHGDIHPGNVIMSADGPVLLDWDLMCSAPPAWDHAMLLTLAERWGGDQRVYRDFSEGYGRSFDDAEGRRFAELRNVAATLMRVRAGRTDPAAAAEAQRRLMYWRQDPDAPTWSAQ